MYALQTEVCLFALAGLIYILLTFNVSSSSVNAKQLPRLQAGMWTTEVTRVVVVMLIQMLTRGSGPTSLGSSEKGWLLLMCNLRKETLPR